jgi:predicted nucleic acid-binding protein
LTALLLDAGALIAVDRDDRPLMARLRAAHAAGMELRSTGIVIAEVWRDPSGRQARLARFLKAVDVVPVDERLGREAGALLGRAGRGQPADATIVGVAKTGDIILSSDPADIDALVAAARIVVSVVGC